MRRITKISLDPKKVRIDFQAQKTEGGSWDRLSVASSDAPRPEFKDALQDLRSYVAEVAGVAIDIEGIKVLAVGLSYSGTPPIMRVSMLARKRIPMISSPIKILTPAVPVSGSKGVATTLLPKTVARTVETLIEEAKKYLDGERSQQEMSLAPPAPGPAKGERKKK